jgi:hypothetical protein
MNSLEAIYARSFGFPVIFKGGGKGGGPMMPPQVEPPCIGSYSATGPGGALDDSSCE